MSYFRDYLIEQGVKPEIEFREQDESWFVFTLLLIRLGLVLTPAKRGMEPHPSPWPLPWTWLWFETFPLESLVSEVPDPLSIMAVGHETQNALKFVSSFLCYFQLKPPKYQKEISDFKKRNIQGFATDRTKQLALLESALPSFWTTPLEEAKWETVAEYFRSHYSETPLTAQARR